MPSAEKQSSDYTNGTRHARIHQMSNAARSNPMSLATADDSLRFRDALFA
jgi:hypothetical protein